MIDAQLLCRLLVLDSASSCTSERKERRGGEISEISLKPKFGSLVGTRLKISRGNHDYKDAITIPKEAIIDLFKLEWNMKVQEKTCQTEVEIIILFSI